MKKRVLFLIPTLAHGGAERVLVNLVNNLDREKYDVTVQTLFDVGVNRQYLHEHIRYIPGIKFMFRGNSYLQQLFTPEFLYRNIVREQYDMIVSYLEGITARIIAGCHNSAVKKVAWIHTGIQNKKMISSCFRSLEEAERCYNSFDYIAFVSRGVEQCFLNNLSIAVPHGVLYNSNETTWIAERAQLCPDDLAFNALSGVKICSVAKLIPIKGFDRLLNVHKRLLDEGVKHTVCIFGIGEEENNLRRKIREYNVEDSFLLMGFKDNPYQYVSRCDLYVCSSRREGFSTAVTESLIVGTPVVSTDCSGARELLGEHNEYGLVVENNEDGIYTGIKRMLTQPETLAHYRAMANARGKHFSKEKTVQAVEEMLDNL